MANGINFHCLTSYNSDKSGSWLDHCPTPLILACGRQVKVSKLETKNRSSSLQFSTEKTHPLGIKIVAGFVAFILFPFTLAEVLYRAKSSKHQELVKNEKQFLKNQEKVIDTFTKQNCSQNKLENLKQMTRFLNQAAVFDKDLSPFIAEFKKQFSAFAFKENSTKEPLSLESLSDEFKTSISYTDLLQLKRSLNLLAWHQHKQHFQKTPAESLPFKQYHALIRDLYYEKFSTEHLVRNLQEKKEIPSIKVTAKDLAISDEEFEDTLTEIQEAFRQQINPSQVTWVHGSQFPTIVGVLKSDKLLKPSGQLRKDKNLAFCGENNKGCFTVNQQNISGVSLDSYQSALDYAEGGIGANDEVAMICTIKPKETIEQYYSQVFQKWIEDFDKNPTDWLWSMHNRYTEQGSSPVELYNIQRHIKILWSLEPQVFEEKLLPLIQDISDKLEQFLSTHPSKDYEKCAKALLKKAFRPFIALKETLPSYTTEDTEIIKKFAPVVFGSTELQLVKKVAADQIGKVAVYRPYMMVEEYTYQGTLELGSELPFVFVPQNEVVKMRRYLVSNNVTNAKVCNLASLHLAPKFLEFKRKKMERKYETLS